MHRIIELLARTMALIGGVVLCLLIILTTASVVGRLLNTLMHGPVGVFAPDFASFMLELDVGPINGDFELVEAGVAFAIFAFIPYCQFTSGHAVVDILTSQFGKKFNNLLKMIAEILFAIVLVVIAIQLFNGMLAKRNFGDTTFLLQFPIWWSYAFSLFAAITASIVAIYMAIIRILEFTTGNQMITSEQESSH